MWQLGVFKSWGGGEFRVVQTSCHILLMAFAYCGGSMVGGFVFEFCFVEDNGRERTKGRGM